MSVEVIFFLVMIALSIMDAIRKKNKGPAGEGEGEAAPIPGTETWPPPADQPEMSIPQGRTAGDTPVTGESMIPKDLWNEIAALARGDEVVVETEPAAEGLDPSVFRAPPARPERSVEKASERTLERAPLREDRSSRELTRSRAPRSRAFRHEIAAEQGEEGVDQSWWEERPESAAILSARLGASGEQPRAAAGHPYLQGRRALRRAIIAREVLGPPKALRDDHGLE